MSDLIPVYESTFLYFFIFLSHWAVLPKTKQEKCFSYIFPLGFFFFLCGEEGTRQQHASGAELWVKAECEIISVLCFTRTHVYAVSSER